MPFLQPEQMAYTGLSPQNPPVPEPEYEFWKEVIPAAFRQENVLWSAWTNGEFETQESEPSSDPNFDPLANIPEHQKLYASRYAFADNEKDVERIKAQIDRELVDRKLLSDSGGEGLLAGILAGVIDPINFIPIGGQVYRSYRLGSSALKAAATVGAVGGVSAAIQEGLLHSTQETRTLEESAVNITGAVILAGLLGAGASRIIESAEVNYASNLADLQARIEAEVNGTDARLAPDGTSAGAMETAGTLAEEGMEQNAATKLLLEKLGMKNLDPMARTISSLSKQSRLAVQRLTEIPETLLKNTLGVASPENVLRGVQNYKADLANALLELDDLYVMYMKGRHKRLGDIALLGTKRLLHMGDNSKLTYKQFREAVGQAMRRGDVHEVPEVQAAAQLFRAKVFDPLKDAAIKRGLLGDDLDPKTAVSYLNRSYDINKMKTKAGYDEFLARTVSWLQTKVDEASRTLAEGVDDAKIKSRAEYYADLTPDELKDIAQDIAHQIMGSSIGRLPTDGSGSLMPSVRTKSFLSSTAKETKARKFLIPDEEIEDFLESDIELLASHYTRSMAPEVEISRIFSDDGNLTNTLDGIRKEWENMTNKPKNWKKLMDNDLRDITAMRDRIKGVYAMPENPESIFHRTAAGIRKLNFITLLGGMTISAVPDLARPIMVNGIKNTFGDILVPFLTNFKTLRLAAREMRDMGAALEYTMASRAASLADVMDETARYTKIERGLGAMSDTFGAVSLMGPWNATLKQIAGITSSQRFIRGLRAAAKGTLSKKEMTFLRENGISESMGKDILEQIEKHGIQEDNLMLTNWGQWDNPEAARIWRNAINKQMDHIILTPGEDIPLTASGGGAAGELGRMALQFKRFAFAANHRMLMAGLQKHDAAFINGLLLSVVLGGLVSHIKATSAGQDTSKWNASKWIVEGIDRSGVTGIFMDVNNIAEKVSRGHLGLSALTEEQASRYASRNVVGALVGPSFGTASQIMSATGNAMEVAFGEGELTKSDVHTIRRLLPYQNLFYTRKAFDMLEEQTNNILGVRK